MTGEPTGYDSAIITVPETWYATPPGGERALLIQSAGRFLRRMSEDMAGQMGEVLHHAEWTITSDPAEVTALGLMHDCVRCRAEVDQILAHLRDHKGAEVAVGQLWWV